MINFSTGKLRKKMFCTNKKLFSFPTAETEKNSWKKLVKQIGENICYTLIIKHFNDTPKEFITKSF